MSTFAVLMHVGFRESYVPLCVFAVKQLKTIHPEISVVIVVDEKFYNGLHETFADCLDKVHIMPVENALTLQSVLLRKTDLLRLTHSILVKYNTILYLDCDLVVLRRLDDWVSQIESGKMGLLHVSPEGSKDSIWHMPRTFCATALPDSILTFNNGIMGFRMHESIVHFFDSVKTLSNEFPGETSDQVYFNVVANQKGKVCTSLPPSAIASGVQYDNVVVISPQALFAHALGLGNTPEQKLRGMKRAINLM